MGNGRSGDNGEHEPKVHTPDPSLKKVEHRVNEGAVFSGTLMEDHVMEGLWNRGCATIFQSLAKVSHNNSVIFITLNTSQGRVCYKVNMHNFQIQRSLHNLVDTFNAVFDQNLLAGMSGPSGVFVTLWPGFQTEKTTLCT